MRGQPDDEEVDLLGHHQELRDPLEITYSEPTSHINNKPKSCRDKVMPCLAPIPDGYELTQAEANFFGRLHMKMVMVYSPTNQKHEQKLRLLYENFLQPCNPPGDPFTLKTKAWGDLGFQGEDPRTDFRGGGYTSLAHIYSFCQEHPVKLAHIKADAPKGLFLFACASIGTTFFIKNYFHMGESPENYKLKEGIAPRRSFKTFCILLVREEDLVKKIHQLLIIRTYDLWTQACAINPQLTIIDSGSAEKQTRDAFKQLFEEKSWQTLDHFATEFNKTRLDPQKVTKFTF